MSIATGTRATAAWYGLSRKTEFSIWEAVRCPRCAQERYIQFRPAGSTADFPALSVGHFLPEEFHNVPVGDWTAIVTGACGNCWCTIRAEAKFSGRQISSLQVTPQCGEPPEPA